MREVIASSCEVEGSRGACRHTLQPCKNQSSHSSKSVYLLFTTHCDVIGIKYGYAFDLLFSNSIAICKNQSQFDSIQEVPCYHKSIYNSYDYFCMIGLFDYFCMITLILILSFCKIHLFISEYFDISPGLRALTDVAAVSGPKRQVVSTSVLSQLHEG